MSDRDLIAKIDGVQSDTTVDAADRIAKLREISEGVKDPAVLGQIGTYIGSLELEIEAGEMRRAMNMLALRENADIRDALIEKGDATPEELDRIGFLSHAELDRREADSTLEKALGAEDEEAVRKLLGETERFETGDE